MRCSWLVADRRRSAHFVEREITVARKVNLAGDAALYLCHEFPDSFVTFVQFVANSYGVTTSVSGDCSPEVVGL